jgi:predicted metal-dependent hydrolase
MTTINIASHTYTYTLLRQPRKSIQLAFIAPDHLLIKAPAQVEETFIRELLTKKSSWIGKQRQVLEQKTLRNALKNGSTLYFKGKALSLEVEISLKKPAVHLSDNHIYVNLYHTYNDGDLKALLLAWYRQQATIDLKKRSSFWSNKLAVTIKKITLKDQKTRWGSCSSLGNINYNWRIIMAPEETIDYLVIHEVAHCIFLDHSSDFWQLVEKHAPAYRSHKKWLKENGALLFKII